MQQPKVLLPEKLNETCHDPGCRAISDRWWTKLWLILCDYRPSRPRLLQCLVGLVGLSGGRPFAMTPFTAWGWHLDSRRLSKIIPLVSGRGFSGDGFSALAGDCPFFMFRATRATFSILWRTSGHARGLLSQTCFATGVLCLCCLHLGRHVLLQLPFLGATCRLKVLMLLCFAPGAPLR